MVMTGRQDYQMGTMDDDEPVEVVSTALAGPLPMQPPTPSPPDRTLADLLAEVILRGKSPQTRKAYRADLEDFLVWVLGRSVHLPAEPDVLRLDPVAAQAVNAALAAVQRVTEADINAYLRHLAGEGGDGMQPATLNRRLTPLRLLFARLHRYHLIAVNPMEFIKSRRLSNVSPTLWLSRQEARALEEACGLAWRAAACTIGNVAPPRSANVTNECRRLCGESLSLRPATLKRSRRINFRPVYARGPSTR